MTDDRNPYDRDQDRLMWTIAELRNAGVVDMYVDVYENGRVKSVKATFGAKSVPSTPINASMDPLDAEIAAAPRTTKTPRTLEERLLNPLHIDMKPAKAG